MWGFLERPSARVIFHGSCAYEGTGALAGCPLHQHQPGFLPQTPGFVASEIWICRLRNQILWRRECQRHSREGIFLAFTATRPCLPLQNSFPINGGNENRGRNISRQTVSIKPHSRLTNKLEEGPKECAQAAPAKYLDIWIQNNIEYQYLFVLKPNIYGRTCFIQEIQSDSSPKSVRSHSKSHLKSS